MKNANAPGVPLPGALGDLTREWLSLALTSAGDSDICVTSLDVHPSILGTGTKIPVSVSYDNAGRDAGLPERLVLKGTFGGHQLSDALRNLQLREARFYRDVAPALAMNLPRCYFAEFDPETMRSVIVLEDMRDRAIVFGAMDQPMDASTVADLLGQLAGLHAATWRSPRLRAFGTWPDLVPELLTREAWRACLEQPYAATVPAALHDYDATVGALGAMVHANRDLPHCLVHGDAHLGNTFRDRNGRPGLLDWQMAMAGPYAADFSELLLSALTIEDRRTHERDLLGLYLDVLAAYGVEAPDFDSAWLSYRQNALYSVMWVTVPEVMQPAAVTALATERASAAVTDLDGLASLGLA